MAFRALIHFLKLRFIEKSRLVDKKYKIVLR